MVQLCLIISLSHRLIVPSSASHTRPLPQAVLTRILINMKIFRILILSILALSFLSIFAAGQTSVSDLKPAHSEVLKKWLATKKGWRLALEKDYGKDNLDYLRSNEGRTLRPFYVAADFNRDKKEDFAVILVIGRNKYAAAVFNAPFSAKGVQQPAFFAGRMEAGDIVLFTKKSEFLIIGPYASDAGFMLKPSRKTYKAEPFDLDK